MTIHEQFLHFKMNNDSATARQFTQFLIQTQPEQAEALLIEYLSTLITTETTSNMRTGVRYDAV